MGLSAFLERYAATEAELQTYTAGLPLWVNVWRGWMFLVFTLSVVFVIRKVEARWMAVTMVVSIIAYNLVSMVVGVGRLPSVAFLVFWSPLAFYFLRRLGLQLENGRFDRAYSVWMRVALVTLCISLAFDTYNVLYALVV
jgi:hypothetical protein